MTHWRLALRGLSFYRRQHATVLAGATAAAAVLVGALVVGDCVRYSLRRTALDRLGQTQLAMPTGPRLFRAELATEVAEQINAIVAPALQLRGVASRPDGTARRNDVNVLGVDERFRRLGGAAALGRDHGAAVVNTALADALRLAPGDELVLRLRRFTAISGDAPLSAKDQTVAARLEIAAVVGPEQFGRFGLQANHVTPANLFVPLGWLQQRIDRPGRANLMLAGSADEDVTTAEANAAVDDCWRLDDAGLALTALDAGSVELTSDELFLPPSVIDAARRSAPSAAGAFTYFVNTLQCGERLTPYSTVAGIGMLEPDSPPAGLAAALPPDLPDDGIVINQWLADDLDAGPGDRVELRYFVLAGDGRLVEHATSFTIHAVVAMDHPLNDRTLMPEFPGLTGTEDCADWDPGVPVDLSRIRQIDEDYWDAYRGTPKAYVTLKAARSMWSNRWGEMTAVRWPSATDAAALRTAMRVDLTPGDFGLRFRNVREPALAAATESLDFGPLFLGLSFFLIVAAVLLTGLLFALGVDQRSEQIGLLKAVGWPARRIKRLLTAEAAMIALIGAIVGAAAGLGYARLVLAALNTIWQDAVASAPLYFHAVPSTITLGGATAFAVGLITMRAMLRRQVGYSPRELLSWQAASGDERPLRGRMISPIVAGVCLLAALVWIGLAIADVAGNVGAFFAAGGLLLIAGVAACRTLLSGLQRRASVESFGLHDVARRSLTRRPGRAIAVIALLACGVFLTVAVGANRKHPPTDPTHRAAGTGGFTLFADTTLPIHEVPQIDEAELVPLRVREGDDASCLNLNRAQTPTLIGVNPQALAERGAFTFTRFAAGVSRQSWALLETEASEDDVIHAVGDEPTVVWGLGLKPGDRINYVDSRGRTVRVEIAGVVAGSIFQGKLLISNDDFVRHFPDVSGYRGLLIDAPPNRAGSFIAELTRRYGDQGMQVTPTADILARFQSVENTYLSIFLALGALALVVGTIGVGVVVVRNTLERRAELALLRAVGFRLRRVRWLLLLEYAGLLAAGVVIGAVAAVIAVAPALLSPGGSPPYLATALTVIGIFISGVIFIRLAASVAIRGNLIAALRNE